MQEKTEFNIPTVFGRAAITLGIGPHSSINFLLSAHRCLLVSLHGLCTVNYNFILRNVERDVINIIISACLYSANRAVPSHACLQHDSVASVEEYMYYHNMSSVFNTSDFK